MKMEERNYWPDLDSEEGTKGVFAFIKILNEQIKEKYNNKIQCSLEEISYKTIGINSAVLGINKLLGPTEEETPLEKGKNKVPVRQTKEFKFLIYNDKYFFRVFDIKIGEFFPVEMKPAEEINDMVKDYFEIESENVFKQQVYNYLNRKIIKDVIRYMVSL